MDDGGNAKAAVRVLRLRMSARPQRLSLFSPAVPVDEDCGGVGWLIADPVVMPGWLFGFAGWVFAVWAGGLVEA